LRKSWGKHDNNAPPHRASPADVVQWSSAPEASMAMGVKANMNQENSVLSHHGK
jgi:hypothetical protein